MSPRTALTPTLLASALLLAGCGDSGDDDPVAPLAPPSDVVTASPDAGAQAPADDALPDGTPGDDGAPVTGAPDPLATAPGPGIETPDASGETPVIPAQVPETESEVAQSDPDEPVPAGPEPAEPEAVEPETTEPETAEPETAEPETAEPETAEPETAEPETAEPETAEPETAEPETAEPETPEPETPEPETPEPETPEPETPEPETTEPETAEPETPEPETTEPETTEPETAEPETTEPETAEPETAEPETTEPETAEPETAEPETAEAQTSEPGPTAPVSPPPPVAGPAAGTPPEGNVPAPSQGSLPLPSDLVDNSPTRAESLSLLGPSRRDASRGDGPPSAPGAPTALLVAGEYVEFSWAPSVDDGAVVAYEIYRDGELLRTVQDSDGSFYERRNWLSTSYVDCNYTRDAACEVQQPASGSSHEYYVVAVDDAGLRSQPSAPTTVELTAQQSTSVDLSGYAEVFADEFDGDSLDRDKWKTALPWGPDTIINGETQYFANLFGSDPIDYDPFVFDGETLSITGAPTPPALSGAANGQPYLSGVVTTADKFSMTYGYVEMSARLASGPGLLSTFYLFNADYERNKPEIDIVEYIGDRPTIAYQTYHYYDSLLLEENFYQGVKHSSPTMATDTGTDLGAGFHTYGVLWEEGLMVWYVDGIEVRRITGPRVSDEPMNIIAHLVIGSEWIGAPDPATLPAEFEIDYVRAYQRD